MQFRTKARAVDLLGKGQIADLPTAITELWKNGYDAYADNLKAELFKTGYDSLEKSYFIISDDGKGMSNTDILDKWLVLGTDSKSRADLDIESEDTLWKKPRIKAGEKGIGRLSIAYVGSPMLMLTKKTGFDIQAVFFDWRLLENYNLFLDDINIPIKSLSDIKGLKDSLEGLKKEFLQNFEENKDSDIPIWEDKQIELKEIIISDINNANLEEPVYNHIIEFFNKEEHGTLFLTFNPIDQILELSEKDEDKLEDRNFVISSLSGFTNPFKETNKRIKTRFNIYKEEEPYNLLTSQGNFFENKDFKLADVYIKGEFNGKGDFEGDIRIYDETVNYSFNNPRKKDKRSFYGNVPIEIGYVVGESKSSNLDETQYLIVSNKVKEYGGLYIYRDDFRVLPYGRSNYDFLRFEERRSKRAGTYFFSYRRMFGFIGLSRKYNNNLKDKSSREGLINNAQLRAFISDNVNFFIALAQDFFATDAKEPIFLDKKKQLNEQNEALNADKAREKKEKIAFTKSLNEYLKKLEKYQVEYEELLTSLDEKLKIVNIGYSEIESILDNLQKLDIDFKDLIPKVPKRYKPTEKQRERLYKFENKLNHYLESVSDRREALNTKAQDKLEVRDLKIDFAKKYNSYISDIQKKTNSHKEILNSKFKELLKSYNEKARKLSQVLEEGKERTIDSIVSKKQIHDLNQSIENKYNILIEEAENKLFPLVNHINRLSLDIDEEQLQGAYKMQYDQMKYQWEQTRDTAQLGIAVEIIDHEFNHLYARINHQLQILNSNDNFNSIKEFKFLEKNFKQLEDKYTLLSPLYRISGATIKDVSCNSIYEYLLEFFEKQIDSYDIQFDVSNSFKNHVIRIKEPIIFTVFINVINNSIYWMRNKEQRVIKLDFIQDTEEIIIANSGDKIPDYRLGSIFELFYSQRPNGRGIGLYLSKQSLNESGLDINANNDKKYNTLKGACFIISKIVD
jgi:hypothetical protein